MDKHVKIGLRKTGSLINHYYSTDLHTVSAHTKINMIKAGISKNILVNIKEDSDLDYDTLSTMLSVSRATLINKKADEKFDQNTSERIMLFAEVMSYGKEVFEDKDTFNHWLKRPLKAFNNQSPLDMMVTVYGMQEVKNELGRIEYGVF